MDSYSVEAILTARDAGFKAGFDQANKSIQNMEKTSKGLGASIKSSFAFGTLVRAGGKAFDFATNSVKSLVGELSSSQATWKTFEGNMKNFGKSQKEITNVKRQLQDFATKTIYSASDMATTYSQLEAVGIKGTTNLVKGFGGLAAAAENPTQAMKTLSQQATQMAAKPKVQWMDFKLMLEQTPAGIAAVAKTMGKSTSQLVKDVQDGKVKTEDFFNAIKKTAGEGTKFYKMATQYKTVGQAMDGLKETLTTKLQPAFDKVSEYGIKAVSKITDMMDKIDGEKLAKTLGKALDKAIPVMENLFKKITPYAISAGKTLVEFGKAAFDVGRSIASNRGVMDAFKNTFSTIGTTIKSVSGFISAHKDTIAKLTPVVLGAIASYKAFSGVKGILDGIFGNKSPLSGKGGGGIAGIIKAVGMLTKNLGTGLKSTFQGLGTMFKGLGTGIATAIKGIAMAFNILQPQGLLIFAGAVAVLVAGLIALSAAKDIVIPFLNGLVSVIQKVAAIIPPLVQGIVTGLVSGIAQGLTTIAPVAQTLASAFVTLTPVISAFGVAFSVVIEAVGTAVATVLPALAPVITSLGVAIATVADSIGTAASKIVTAFTPIVSIIGNVITRVIAILAPYIPNIQKMVEATASAISSICSAFISLVSNLSGIINSIKGLVTELGTQICNIFTQIQNTITIFGNTVCQILTTFSTTVSSILSSVGNLFTTFGTTVQTVMNSASNVITSVGESIRTILDGIAGIFTSMGTAAKNAGTGVLNLANGIKILVGLNLADLTATLIATAKGLSSMANSGNGLSVVATALSKIGPAGAAARAGLSQIASAAKAATVALTTLNTAATATANVLKTAGTQGGTGFAKGIQNGVKSATITTKTGMTTIVNTIKKAISQGTSAGQRLGSGIANGLRSGLSSVGSICSSATSTIASRVRSGYSSAYSAGYHVGSGVAAGLRASIPAIKAAAADVVSAGNKAGVKKGQIGSPSKLTKKDIGIPLAQGIAVGIKQTTGYVKKTFGSVIDGTIKYGDRVAEIHSPSKKTAKTGKNLSKGVQKGVKSNKKALKASIKKDLVNVALKSINGMAKAGAKEAKGVPDTAKKLTTAAKGDYSKAGDTIQKSIKSNLEDKQKDTLKTTKTKIQTLTDKLYGTYTVNKKIEKNEQKINKLSAKKSTKANKAKIKKLKETNKKLKNSTKKGQTKSNKLSKTVYEQYEKYLKNETDKLVAASDSSIKKITDTYQDLYNKVIDKRTNFFNKLSNIGDLYTFDTETNIFNKLQEIGSLFSSDDYGYTKLKDFKTATKQVEQFTSNVNKLKSLLPEGLIKEIAGLDTGQGLELTNRLLKMSSSELKEYGNDYSNFMKTVENAQKTSSTMQLKDFTAATQQINQLSNNVEKLKTILPDGLMEEIVGMETNQALEYTNELLKMSTTQLQNYGKQYSTFISTASNIAERYYKPQLENIKNTFNTAIADEMKTLQTQMNQLGQTAMQSFLNGLSAKSKELKSVAQSIGKSTQTGMAKGTKKSTKKSTKASSKAAGKNTKATKKKLKSHSPSRVYEDIGMNTGLGYIKGINQMVRRTERASENLVAMPTIRRPDLSLNNPYYNPSLNSEYNYGNIQIGEITVVTNIDGKEAARAMVDPMADELNKKQTRENRRKGAA